MIPFEAKRPSCKSMTFKKKFDSKNISVTFLWDNIHKSNHKFWMDRSVVVHSVCPLRWLSTAVSSTMTIMISVRKCMKPGESHFLFGTNIYLTPFTVWTWVKCGKFVIFLTDAKKGQIYCQMHFLLMPHNTCHFTLAISFVNVFFALVFFCKRKIVDENPLIIKRSIEPNQHTANIYSCAMQTKVVSIFAYIFND